MSFKYKLRDSIKSVGELYPILLDSSGKHIIDGAHRLKDNPLWKKHKLENIRSNKQILIARIVTNLCRRQVSILERYEIFEKLAAYLKNCEHIESKNIAKEISHLTGISYRTVCRYLPEKYKDIEKVHLRRRRDAKKKFRIDGMTPFKRHINDLPYYETHERKIKMIHAPKNPNFATIVEVSVLSHQSTKPHLHYGSNEYAFVIKGKGRCTIKDQEIPLEKNTVILCPMNNIHWYTNDGDTTLKVFCVYTPPLDLRTNLDLYKASIMEN